MNRNDYGAIESGTMKNLMAALLPDIFTADVPQKAFKFLGSYWPELAHESYAMAA